MGNKKIEVESDLLEMSKQKEIKWELLTNPKGGVFCLTPETESFENGLDDILFYVDRTCVGFFIVNWKEFFANENAVLSSKKFMAHIEVVEVAPTSISEGGPFIGGVNIVHLGDCSSK